MSSALNRTTKQYLTSVNTPDFPLGSWIINPDVSAVAGFATRYWTITGDVVTLMSQGQRDALDALLLGAARDAIAAKFDAVDDINRAFALVLLDELNAHADKINEILAAIDAGGTLAAVKANIAAIADYPDRTIANLKTALRGKLGT